MEWEDDCQTRRFTLNEHEGTAVCSVHRTISFHKLIFRLLIKHFALNQHNILIKWPKSRIRLEVQLYRIHLRFKCLGLHVQK